MAAGTRCPQVEAGQPFALLDDALSSGPGRSRLCTDLVAVHESTGPDDLTACWARVTRDLQAGLHAVVLADYEWGVALQGLAPLVPGRLRVCMFRRLDRLDAEQVQAWLAAQEGQATPGVAGPLDLAPEVEAARFTAAIDAIHAAIRAGETYQVNYTYRLHGRAHGSPWALYRRLRARQPVAYGALLALPEDRWVLSLSPELFLQVAGRQVTARPMKGTAARALDPQEDARQAQALRQDVKNRAENLMIVDLLRNDLGRLAETGSVRVPALFDVEPYPTVWQMTSTIEARLRPEVDWPALWRATFPCGSITGAPKYRTMQHIQRLEASPRGLYCGAIGWIEAGEGLGQATLSVAIRTLTLGPAEVDTRSLVLGVGAGIVLDSDAAQERAECALKARFLTALDPGLGLFETLRLEQGDYPLLAVHLDRLARSAARLGFPFAPAQAVETLQRVAQQLPGPGPHRVRLDLAADGTLRVRHAPLAPLPPGPVRLAWGQTTVPRGRALAGLKTTDRALYDGLVAEAEAQGAFDALLFSTDGWLLEGGRSNILLRLDAGWVTPPVADGLLPGVMRAQLLADPAWALRERSIHRDELGAVREWRVCNALRGVLAAQLLPPQT
ncbi:aminodeoxychorismate synthase component I [Ideonella sp. B7]|uniref:aminodeoxychorismate synthase component I n=1 Tax=Ideonella benzenivorans TaxID=2831643 RepID=UPI001CED3C3C|nr:aminodeoxychorismate synthase component I [Ideonella benzenivorans]MCA6217691.1 aminodeoxychorismate synthase component I [Ideonella benzenivorans]